MNDLLLHAFSAGSTLAAVAALVWREQTLRRRLRQKDASAAASEERLAYVLRASQDGFWSYDYATDHLERTDRWALMLGYPPAEIPLTVAGWENLVHPDDLQAHRQLQAKLAAGEIEMWSHELRMRAKSGDWRCILSRGRVLARGPDGRPLRASGTHTDVSDRKRTEEALRRCQRLLDRSQEAAGIGGWELDVLSKELYWTRQTYRLHDMDPERGPPLLTEAINFYTPNSRKVLEAALARALNDGVGYQLEVEIVPHGSRRCLWARTTGRVHRDATGRITQLFGSFQDITRQKEDEEARVRLQEKMVEAQRLESLGVLAGGIAHEFNNLLTVVLGNTALARVSQGKLHDHLTAIDTAAHRSAELCKQMLSYAGQSRCQPEYLDVNLSIQQSLPLFELAIGKNATLALRLGRPLPRIEVDPAQLRQAFLNLVVNAAEAIQGREGHIQLATSLVQATRARLAEAIVGHEAAEGPYVVIDVIDDGCGLDPQMLPRIFDPFYTTKFTGRGLGLAAVASIVRSHRCAFFVRSEPGKGSTFSMWIPGVAEAPAALVDSSAPVVRRSDEPAKPQNKGRVLIVDDEPDVRMLAHVMLKRHGFSTTVASTGDEAVMLAQGGGADYAVVLLDLTMPGMDGRTTLSRLRALNPNQRVLLMSGYAQREARDYLNGQPLTSFLQKPFTFEELLARIDELTGRIVS